MHTAEQLISEASAFEVENLQWHKSPGNNQITAELIKARVWTIHYEIHKLINSIWNMEESPEVWTESIIIPIYKGDKKRL
jgi:hypothetical protein